MDRSASSAPLQVSRLNFWGRERSEDAGEQRGVSPVIGIVLMLAVTISLAMLVVPLVFSVAGDTTDPAPTASFSYSYTEAIDSNVDDDFGQTGSSADGILRIDLKRGDHIDAGQLRIDAVASGGNWVDDTDPSVYDVGDTVAPGDSISVWANRGERVEVIWTSSTGDESEILAEFNVAPSASGAPPGAPSPDDDCDYVDDNIQDTSTPVTLNIDGVVVQCDLESYPDLDELTIQNDGALIGDAVTDLEVRVSGGSQVYGEVDTDSVILSDDAIVNGKVTASSDFESTDSEVDGRVDTGFATLNWGTSIRLGLDADNIVTMDRARVGGDVIADNDVTLDNKTVVEQDVKLDPSTSDLNCDDGDDSTINGQGCETYASADYTVAINDTNEPIEDGEHFNTSIEVTNVGYRSDTKTVELRIDGTVENSTSVNLAAGANQTEPLQWKNAPKGNYTVKVKSPDDAVSQSLRVYESGEAPRNFESLSAAITNSSGDITQVDFDWTTDRKANITFEVTKGGVQKDFAEETLMKSNVTTLDSLSVTQPAYVRANIHNGECYEYEVPSDAPSQTVDMLEDGWNC